LPAFVLFVATLKIRLLFSYAFFVAAAVSIAFLVVVLFGYSLAAEIANTNSINFSHF